MPKTRRKSYLRRKNLIKKLVQHRRQTNGCSSSSRETYKPRRPGLRSSSAPVKKKPKRREVKKPKRPRVVKDWISEDKIKRVTTIQANSEKRAQHQQRKAAEKAAAAATTSTPSALQAIAPALSPLRNRKMLNKKKQKDLPKVTVSSESRKTRRGEQLRKLKKSVQQKRVQITPISLGKVSAQAQAAKKKRKSARVMMHNPSKAGSAGSQSVPIIGTVSSVPQKVVCTTSKVSAQAQAAKKKCKSAPVMMHNSSKAGTAGSQSVRIIGTVSSVPQKVMYTTTAPGQVAGVRAANQTVYTPYIPGVRSVLIPGQKLPTPTTQSLQGTPQRLQMKVQQTTIRPATAGREVNIGFGMTAGGCGTTSAVQTQLTGQVQVFLAQLFTAQAQVVLVGGQTFMITPAEVQVQGSGQVIQAQLVQTTTPQDTTIQRLVLTENAQNQGDKIVNQATTSGLQQPLLQQQPRLPLQQQQVIQSQIPVATNQIITSASGATSSSTAAVTPGQVVMSAVNMLAGQVLGTTQGGVVISSTIPALSLSTTDQVAELEKRTQLQLQQLGAASNSKSTSSLADAVRTDSGNDQISQLKLKDKYLKEEYRLQILKKLAGKDTGPETKSQAQVFPAKLFTAQAQVVHVGGQKFVITPAQVQEQESGQMIQVQVIQTTTPQGTTIQRLVLTPNAQNQGQKIVNQATTSGLQQPLLQQQPRLPLQQQVIQSQIPMATNPVKAQVISQIIPSASGAASSSTAAVTPGQVVMPAVHMLAGQVPGSTQGGVVTLLTMPALPQSRTPSLSTSDQFAELEKRIQLQLQQLGAATDLKRASSLADAVRTDSSHDQISQLKLKDKDLHKESRLQILKMLPGKDSEPDLYDTLKKAYENKAMAKKKRAEQRRMQVIQSMMKAMLRKIERDEKKAVKQKYMEEQREVKRQRMMQQKRAALLSEQKITLRNEILVRRTLLEQKLTFEIKEERSRALLKKAAEKACKRKAANRKKSRAPKKRQKVSESPAKKSPAKATEKQALYCICQTKYDSSRFYVGCDMCLNWFHGTCVNVDEQMAKDMAEYICDECTKTKQEREDELYCICRLPYDETRFYIGCAKCSDRFHGSCVGITQEEAEVVEEYICPRCNLSNIQNVVASQKTLTAKDYDQLRRVVQQLESHKMGWPFLEPVSELDAPDYYDVIKDSVDLSGISDKLKKKTYIKVNEFVADVSKMFDNCRLYNSSDSMFFQCADMLEKFFVQKMKNFKQ